ncbi:MAG: DUF512 domain-containing protein, partial [Oscillospiraceae bacterium]
MVLINNVIEKSIASRKKIQKGDQIISINGNSINDVLDFDFYAADAKLKILLLKNGKEKIITIKKDEYEDIGIEFSSYLIDKQHSCTNNCIFCFVDQMPKGCRDSLYFKDDDDRLSFIFGNYVTLTNMPESEIDRIIKMNISPINISVHTTNKELRCKMMNNRFAGEKLSYITKLAKANIKINCQFVLCPNINDGAELEKSLNDLSNIYDINQNIESIACVPVGVTRFREGLFPMETYVEKTANETIDIIEKYAEKFFKKYHTHLCYASDEFYIKAKREIPPYEYYEDFAQLDNGVGMIALSREEFKAELEFVSKSDIKRHVTIATGVDAEPFIKYLVDMLFEKFPNLKCDVIPIKNNFFGETITVAGLIVGEDLQNQLKNIDLG